MIGLVLASFCSVFNVLTDVSRKKVLDHQHDAALIGFWCKAIALVCYLCSVVALSFQGVGFLLPPIGSSFGLSRGVAFILYLLLNALLEGSAIMLNYRALQLSPLSLCVPFTALTPVFLLPIGQLFLHERISVGMLLGVSLVVVGSLAMNRGLVAQGWLEPAKSILREKGSRYMLLVALLLTSTVALDKWFVMSGDNTGTLQRLSLAFTLSLGKCIMLMLFFAALSWVRIGRSGHGVRPLGSPSPALMGAWRTAPRWLVAAGVFEAVVMVFYLVALQFAVAAIVISIKRSGILLACVLGWFAFGERGITDRVIPGAKARRCPALSHGVLQPQSKTDFTLWAALRVPPKVSILIYIVTKFLHGQTTYALNPGHLDSDH